MNDSLHVLITGVGGPTPRSFARAIKEIGHYKTYKLIGTDIHPYAIGLYQKELFDNSYITPRSSQLGYWDVIEEIIEKEKIDIAIILPEQEVVTWSERQKTGKLPCKALIPPVEVAQKMLDKGVLTKALENSGLVPDSVIIDIHDAELKNRTESKLKYPYWIRSATGSSGLGSFKIENFQDLEKWISINKGINNFIASKYLSGRNLACKMLYFHGKLIRAACGERIQYIMSKVSPSGITGNTSYGKLINDENVFQIANKAMDIMFSSTGAVKHGFYTVDLKEDSKGIPFITEINVRHVAFTQCFAAGGANLCEDTIRILDEDPNFDYDFKLYHFEEGILFLRDVDERPILLKEENLLKII